MRLIDIKIENYVIVASLKSEPIGKLINRIRGSRFLLQDRQALRCQQAFSKPCMVNLISKDTHLVISIQYKRLVIKACENRQFQHILI